MESLMDLTAASSSYKHIKINLVMMIAVTRARANYVMTTSGQPHGTSCKFCTVAYKLELAYAD